MGINRSLKAMMSRINKKEKIIKKLLNNISSLEHEILLLEDFRDQLPIRPKKLTVNAKVCNNAISRMETSIAMYKLDVELERDNIDRISTLIRILQGTNEGR